jgi:hypothetical protein
VLQASAWITLLQRIPADKQDQLSLRTTAGVELMVQSILRFEADCLVMLGRTAGSTDNGLLLFVPYDELSFVGFVKRLTPAELNVILGSGRSVASAAAPGPVEVPPNEHEPAGEDAAAIESEEAEGEEEENPAEPRPPQFGARKKAPSKSLLLARLRERLAGDGTGSRVR